MDYKKMINNQYSLDDLQGSCGRWGSIQCDGNGAIAVYNVLQLLDKEYSLEEVIKVLSKSHCFILGGLGGLSPFRLRRALKKFGVKLKFKWFFTSFNKLSETHKFIIYYTKFDRYDWGIFFQAGRLVKDTHYRTWIELFNPFHRYINLSQFKDFEKARLILLFTIE
jgi:hypothetical protein